MGNSGGKHPSAPVPDSNGDPHFDPYLDALEKKQVEAKKRRSSVLPEDSDLQDESLDAAQNLTSSKDPQDWIQLTATREECTDFLEYQSEGAFVVYRDASPEKELRLAVKVHAVIRHEPIIAVPKEGYSLALVGAPLQPIFAKLDELLVYYQQPRPGIPVVLLTDNPLFGSDLLTKFKGARMASTYSPDKPGVQRRTSVRTAEELSSFKPLVLSEEATAEIARSSMEAAQPKPKQENIPDFARRVAESDAAAQLRKSTENLAEASNAPSSSQAPSKPVVKTEPVSYEDWVPGSMPPPASAYGFQPTSPKPAAKEAEAEEFGFDADDIEAAAASAAGPSPSKQSSLKGEESTYGTASDLKAPQPAVVIAQDSGLFYGSSTINPLRAKDAGAAPVLSSPDQELYGSPQKLTASSRPASKLIEVEEQLYGSPQQKKEESAATPVASPPVPEPVVVISSSEQGAPAVVISSTTALPIVVPPVRTTSLEASTSQASEVKTPDTAAKSYPILAVPQSEVRPESPSVASVRRAPEPPSRPSLEANAASRKASAPKESSADKDGLYEFPVVIGHRDGKNPTDVFEWARGTDVFLSEGRPSPPWIHGSKITRVEAERIFARLGNIDGMFLIRQRVTETSLSYALSIVVELHIEHHIIDVQPSRYSLLGTYNIATVTEARSLEDLIRQLGTSNKAARPQLAVSIPYIKEDQYNRPEWLHGTISRDEACYRLFQDEKFVDGRFLVRVSTKQHQSQAVYVISLVYNQQFHHHLVSVEHNQWFLNNVLCKGAASLSDVVQWMMRPESNLECLLQTYIPCPPPYYLLKLFDPLPRAASISTFQPPPPRLRASSTSIPSPMARSNTMDDKTKAQAAAAAIRQTVPPAFHREDHFSSSPGSSSPLMSRQSSEDPVSPTSPSVRSPLSHSVSLPDTAPLIDPAEPPKKDYDNVYADANTIFYEVEQLLRPEEESFLKPADPNAPPTFIRPRVAPAPPRAASPATVLSQAPAAVPVAEDE